MEQLTDLKAILHSKRANIYYLEKCRVMQKDGRVLYLSQTDKDNLYWNIPIANTTCLLLGTGTSLTQAAARMLAQAGVLVGFCGTGGTPLIMANEIEWLSPQSEYRPTEYVQSWLSWWFDDEQRLERAKYFQLYRIMFLKHIWQADNELKQNGFEVKSIDIEKRIDKEIEKIDLARSVSQLLQQEALFTKALYKAAALASGQALFSRVHKGGDKTNDFLNHGNYLAYGLAATTLWALGIPHAFAVMHGKTRRGALVFDVADLVKDALVLPWAFICAKENATEQEFRLQCLRVFVKHGALDRMFDTVKSASEGLYRGQKPWF